ncbi:D-alanine--D-alanine ligase family protein [Cerasicoccus arenae]|uniref:D-alanine--D-alanine ligase n=1 Tax=Cerasicoccus arenae TaxID=424488 RepID=A0A8J3DDP6_9BACT|nr:D-alanine--D-alanine ligase [Cerasicoccus arenae]MBK1856851.1 D-alanine--D-alanine ligase [Cerasicoccus arenae]GHC11276.1 D-alanine--D-alanine ligase [Cerasicoccus arenae]
MSERQHVTVLCGGDSPEAEVSRVTGRSVAEALGNLYDVELIDLAYDHLPPLDSERTVVFPAMHGPFGEDGQLQALLDKAGVSYAGCGAESSALCIHKINAKATIAESGFERAKDLTFIAKSKPSADIIMASLGDHLVLKPTDSGSSVGVHISHNRYELTAILEQIKDGHWMAEQFITGREMTIGLLDGKAMGIVEIRPKSGVYDFQHKYTNGATEYLYPADINETLACKVKTFAENAFAACSCRDFARLDFIITSDERPYFLEINTIPGMTPTSLLPKSASCIGLGFQPLVRRMVEPAIVRAVQARAAT